MTETSASVTVRYWAAARAATGVDDEARPPARLEDLLETACAEHPDLGRVVAVASFLCDGASVGRDADVPPGATLDVLPPFAGG